MATTKKRLSRIVRLALAALALAAAGVAVAAVAMGLSAYRFRASNRIANGVRIEGIDVGGLRREEAVELLRTKWAATLPRRITLVADSEKWQVEPERLGVRLDIERAVDEALAVGRSGNLWETVITGIKLRRHGVDIRVPVDIDRARLRRALVELAPQIERQPRDAKVKVVDGRVEIEPEQVGRTLDLDNSLRNLISALADPHCRQIQLALHRQQPSVKANDLKHLNCVLGRYSTRFNPAQRNRTHNLKLAASVVNETIVMPGEEFSLNQALGPRIIDRGYKNAPTYINGRSVPTPGGGVCQIATTIYNAALLAGLDITERHHHSKPVPYCPTGRDATVYYGALDLKFRNNLAHPILLLCWVEGNRLHASIIGSREDKVEVKLVRSNVGHWPRPVKIVEDPSLPPGKKVVEEKGNDGYRATLTRIITKDGKVVAREVLHTDVYQARPKVIRVGKPKSTTPGPPVPGGLQASGTGTSGVAASRTGEGAAPRGGHGPSEHGTDQ